MNTQNLSQTPVKFGIGRWITYILGIIIFGALGVAIMFGVFKDLTGTAVAKQHTVTVNYDLGTYSCPTRSASGQTPLHQYTYSLSETGTGKAYELYCVEKTFKSGDKLTVYITPWNNNAYLSRSDIIGNSLEGIGFGAICLGLVFWLGKGIVKRQAV